METIWKLNRKNKETIRKLHGNYTKTLWKLYETIWKLNGKYMETLRKLYEN